MHRAAVGQNIDKVEGLEGTGHRKDHADADDGLDVRQHDVAVDLSIGGAVQHGGFPELRRHALDARIEEQHVIAHILPERGHKHRPEGGTLLPEPDPGPAFQADLAEKNVQNTVIRIVDLQPELADDHGGDQNRHEVDGKEKSLAPDLFAQGEGETESQGQLEKYRQSGQQQGVAQRLHETDGIAGEKLLVILQSDKDLRPESVPFEEAEIRRSADRRDENAAEQDQCRKKKQYDIDFFAVHPLHSRVPPMDRRGNGTSHCVEGYERCRF